MPVSTHVTGKSAGPTGKNTIADLLVGFDPWLFFLSSIKTTTVKSNRNARVDAAFRVGLLLQTGQDHMRGVARGVFHFLREKPHWQIVGEGFYPLLDWEQLDGWRGDGLIAMANSERQVAALLAADVPVVNTGSRFLRRQWTSVTTDSVAIGRLAAEHLLACGLEHFLFIGQMLWDNEVLRRDGFARRVRDAGFDASTFDVPLAEHVGRDGSPRYRPDVEQVVAGLARAKKPVGVLAPNSVLARAVIEAATRAGYLVPDQIAVIGVNEDPLVCESTDPPLSAVAQASEKIGLEAARRLDRLMRGESVEPRHVTLPPRAIVARRSTDMLAVDDPTVAAVLRFIRENAQEPIEVADVVETVDLSRRTLETKFLAATGRTLAVELRRVRVERAKRLLTETNDPITNIVFACGFNSRQVFCNIFRRETGMTPSEFRGQFKLEVLA